MQDFANTLIDTADKCWTCPLFDALFAIISNCAGKVYQQLTFFAVITFVILLSFYIVNAVWQNIKQGGKDPLFQESVKPVLIKSLLALSLLTAGLMIPRLISMVIFEPVAEITYNFSKAILPDDYVLPPYTHAATLQSYSFFTSDLRDTILKILETSVSNFQVYLKFGIAILDKSFSFMDFLRNPDPFRGTAMLFRHIFIFFIGIFLTYNFGKLFIKYSFCFMDVIVAMAMFAFFFPLSIVFFIFKDAKNAPEWMKKLGGDLGSGQIKKLVNAIVSIAAAILTYTIIMMIISGFLKENGVNMEAISNSSDSFIKQLFEFDLDNSSAMEITLAGAIVLVYVINYISDKVPEVSAQILSAFGVSKNEAASNEAGESAWQLTSMAGNKVKEIAKNIVNPGADAAGSATKAATTGTTTAKP